MRGGVDTSGEVTVNQATGSNAVKMAAGTKAVTQAAAIIAAANARLLNPDIAFTIS